MGQYLEEIWEASGFEVCCLFSAALGADTLNPVCVGGGDGRICFEATRDSSVRVWEFTKKRNMTVVGESQFGGFFRLWMCLRRRLVRDFSFRHSRQRFIPTAPVWIFFF